MADHLSKDGSKSGEQSVSQWSPSSSEASSARSSQPASGGLGGESQPLRPTSPPADQPSQDPNIHVDPTAEPAATPLAESDESVNSQEATHLRDAHARRRSATRNSLESFPAFRDVLTSRERSAEALRAPPQSQDPAARLAEASRNLEEELASATRGRDENDNILDSYFSGGRDHEQPGPPSKTPDLLEPDDEYTVEDTGRPTLPDVPRQAVAAGLRAQQNRDPRQVRRTTGQHDLLPGSSSPPCEAAPAPPLHHPQPLPPQSLRSNSIAPHPLEPDPLHPHPLRSNPPNLPSLPPFAPLNPFNDPFRRPGYIPFPTPTEHIPPALTPDTRAAIASPESEAIDQQLRNHPQIRAGESLDSDVDESASENEGLIMDARAVNARLTYAGANGHPPPPRPPAQLTQPPVPREVPSFDEHTMAQLEGHDLPPRIEDPGSGYQEDERTIVHSEASATPPWIYESGDAREPPRSIPDASQGRDARSARPTVPRGLPAEMTSGQYLAGLLAWGSTTSQSSPGAGVAGPPSHDSSGSFAADILGGARASRPQPRRPLDDSIDDRREPDQGDADEPQLLFAAAARRHRSSEAPLLQPQDSDAQDEEAPQQDAPQQDAPRRRKFSILDGMSPQATRRLPEIQRQLGSLSLRLGELGMHSHILRRDGLLMDESSRSPIPSPMELEVTPGESASQTGSPPLELPGPLGNSLPLNTNIDGTKPARVNRESPGPRGLPWIMRQLLGMRDIGLHGQPRPQDDQPRQHIQQQPAPVRRPFMPITDAAENVAHGLPPGGLPVHSFGVALQYRTTEAPQPVVDQWLNHVQRPAQDPLLARSELARRYQNLTVEVLDVLRELAGTLPGIRYQSADDHRALQSTIRVLHEAWTDAIQSYATVQEAEWDTRPIERWREIMESIDQDVERLRISAGFRTDASYALEFARLWDQARAERKAKEPRTSQDTEFSESWDRRLADLKEDLKSKMTGGPHEVKMNVQDWPSRNRDITRTMRERERVQRHLSPPSPPRSRRGIRYNLMKLFASFRHHRERQQRARSAARRTAAHLPPPPQHTLLPNVPTFEPPTNVLKKPNPAYAAIMRDYVREYEETPEETDRREYAEYLVVRRGHVKDITGRQISDREHRMWLMGIGSRARSSSEEREEHRTPRVFDNDEVQAGPSSTETRPVSQAASATAPDIRAAGDRATGELRYPTLPQAEEGVYWDHEIRNTQVPPASDLVRTSNERVSYPTLPLTTTPPPPSDHIANFRRRGLQPLQTLLSSPGVTQRSDMASSTAPEVAPRNASSASIGPHNQRERSGTVYDLRSPFDQRPSVSEPATMARKYASDSQLRPPSSSSGQNENLPPRPSTSRTASGGRPRVVSPSLQGRLTYFEALDTSVSPTTMLDESRRLSLQNTPGSYPNLTDARPTPGSLPYDRLPTWQQMGLSGNFVRQSRGRVQGPRNPSLQGTGVGARRSPPGAEVAAAEQRERQTQAPTRVADVREVEGTATATATGTVTGTGMKHADEEEERRREGREDSMAQPRPS